MTVYNVAVGNDDFYTSQPDGSGVTYVYTSSTILASRNEFISPALTKIANVHIDTSPIPDTDLISSASFHMYLHSYTASRRVTKIYTLQMLNSSGTSWVNVGSGTFISAGWVSFNLSATQLTYINKIGLTKFRVTVPSPGIFKTRDMAIRAYEYTGSYTAYLDVIHSAVASFDVPKYYTSCTP